jgi:hypothetical protein
VKGLHKGLTANGYDGQPPGPGVSWVSHADSSIGVDRQDAGTQHSLSQLRLGLVLICKQVISDKGVVDIAIANQSRVVKLLKCMSPHLPCRRSKCIEGRAASSHFTWTFQTVQLDPYVLGI